jgi:hypothetical protein
MATIQTLHNFVFEYLSGKIDAQRSKINCNLSTADVAAVGASFADAHAIARWNFSVAVKMHKGAII